MVNRRANHYSTTLSIYVLKFITWFDLNDSTFIFLAWALREASWAPDSLNDGAVVEEGEGHWEKVVESETEENEALVVEVVGEVIVWAGEEHTLGGVSSPDTCWSWKFCELNS